MILPFTTNQWNALRFFAVSIVCVPILERALHRLHQLRVAHRLLNSKPARIRPSYLGNWGLHQEVDELNYRSKVSSILVALLYLGFSLYTEYASGSQQVHKTRIWLAPASTNSSLQGKPKLYDTNLVGAWPDAGCMSKASRMAIHNLSEDIVVRKVQAFISPPSPCTGLEAATEISSVYDVSTGFDRGMYDNGTHLIFRAQSETFGITFYAAIDDEKVCITNSNESLACFGKSENISVVAVIGNLIHFQYGLFGFPAAGTKVLLSNDAFTVEAIDEERREYRAPVMRARTRTEFLKIRPRNSDGRNFAVKFKYATSATGHICKEEPQIEPKILRMPRNPKLILHDKPEKISIRLNRTAMCIGLFKKDLIMFEETRNSSMVCYGLRSIKMCARNQSDGTINLIGIVFENHHFINWIISFRDQGIRLADLARAAFVSVAMSWKVHGFHSFNEEAKQFLKYFEKGMPKSTQVGVSHSVYTEVIRTEERATMITWVLILWVLLFFLGLSYLLYTTKVKAQLFPDVDFLYRRAVMQRHTRFNSVKSICNPPTVNITKTGELVQLNISYEDVEPGNTTAMDVVI